MVFVVDSNDRDRKEELFKEFSLFIAEFGTSLPILIFANKRVCLFSSFCKMITDDFLVINCWKIGPSQLYANGRVSRNDGSQKQIES